MKKPRRVALAGFMVLTVSAGLRPECKNWQLLKKLLGEISDSDRDLGTHHPLQQVQICLDG
jgi:hypothetical protein